jgi:hypothetical protein
MQAMDPPILPGSGFFNTIFDIMQQGNHQAHSGLSNGFLGDIFEESVQDFLREDFGANYVDPILHYA